MDFRKLKILSKPKQRRWSFVFVPEIRLEGKWLEELGFKIGKEVLVKQQRNKLTITLKKEEKSIT
jgi:toxic protein SymE